MLTYDDSIRRLLEKSRAMTDSYPNGVVNGPQFDRTVFRLGWPVCFRQGDEQAKYGLVVQVEPHNLYLVAYDPKEVVRIVKVSLQDVISGAVQVWAL